MRRKLPVLLERDLHETRATRAAAAASFHEAVRDAAEDRARAITCSKACSGCCYHPVFISLLEGILLYRWLVEHGQWSPALRARLTEHATSTLGLAYEVWFLSGIACPLLDDSDACTAHEGRPFVCRVTWSVGDPWDCHPHRFGPKTGILPRAAVVRSFELDGVRRLREHRLPSVPLPISKAVLLAESLVSGELTLDALPAALAKEYRDIG